MKKSAIQWILITLILGPIITFHPCNALEATWTPNQEDANGSNNGGGPLPQSQNQRQKLLELEQAITSSPDPEATLRRVAEANQMSPQDLVDLLHQNRQDMVAAGAGAGAGAPMANAQSTLPRKFLKLMSAAIVMIGRYATINPKGFTMIVLALILVGYTTIMAPKTGIVLSTSNSLLSNGHTTFFTPPPTYIQNYLTHMKKKSSSIPKIGLSRTRKDILLDILENEDEDEDFNENHKEYIEDGLQFHKTGRKATFEQNKNLILGVSSRKTISLDSLLNDDYIGITEEIADIAYTAGQTIIASRRFTEFAATNQLRFQSQSSSSSKKKLSCISMKNLGNWNRFGIQPLGVAHEENVSLPGVEVSEVAFYTIKGGHFDGEILIALEKWRKDRQENDVMSTEDDNESENDDDKDEHEDQDINVVLSVSLFIPKKGRKPSKKLSERLVTSLTESIVTSIKNEAKKNISRKIQLGSIQKRTQSQAKQRRHDRAENVKKIEEMARDRRRRWQRGPGGDAGRYRPSGDRMRSPNNC